jgi:hypothetical protein
MVNSAAAQAGHCNSWRHGFLARTESPLSAAHQLPPHIAQHVADLLQQLVRLVEPARGIGAAAGLAGSC